MGIYNEIHISTIERKRNENLWLDRVFEPGTPASLVWWRSLPLSYPGQLISMYQCFCLLGNRHVFTLPKLIDLNDHSTKCNRKERKYRKRINNFFNRKRKMYNWHKALKMIQFCSNEEQCTLSKANNIYKVKIHWQLLLHNYWANFNPNWLRTSVG